MTKIHPTVEDTLAQFTDWVRPLSGAAMTAARWLGKAKMVAALPATGHALYDVNKKDWDYLFHIIDTSDEAIQMAIIHAAVKRKAGQVAEAKARRARKAKEVRREQRLAQLAEAQTPACASTSTDEGPRDLDALVADPAWRFLKLPTVDERKECYRSFRDATSNEALAVAICVVCGRELRKEEGMTHILHNVPNLRKYTTPEKSHPSHELWDGMLILGQYVEGYGATAEAWICDECYRALNGNSLPKFALTNNLWPGRIPHELSILTLPEQLLIARHYPRCYVVKLFPKQGSHNPEHVQRGISGNVSLYEMNTEAVAQMVAGQKMPQPPASLASVLAITFIGSRKLPKNWLRHTFRVRRTAVRDALLWLKANNHLYHDINIQEQLLEKLPVDDIPAELLTTIRQEDNNEVAERERETYVPSYLEDRDDVRVLEGEETRIEANQEVGSEMDFEIGSWNGDEYAGGSDEGEVIPLQYLGVTDVDHSRLSVSEVMKHALANTVGAGKEGGYGVRYGGPVGTFGRDKDTGRALPVNPLAAAYPDLWPWGIGGPEDSRDKTVGYMEHIRWTMEFHDRRFRTHHSFPFVAYAISQLRNTLCSARLQMKRQDFDREAVLLSSLTLADLREAEKEEEEGKPISNPRVRLLKKHVFATSRRVSGSNQKRAGYRGQIWGTCLYLSAPSLWITLNPSDTHDPVAQVFAGETIDMDNFHRLAGPDRDRRAQNIAKDPFAATKFFFFIIRTVLETVFGVKVVGSRVQARPGVMGVLSGYFGVVEAQGRGTLHVHMFLWLADAPNSEEMLGLLKTEAFRDRVRSFIKENIRAHLDAFTEDDIRNIPVDREVAYCRPPDPDAEDFQQQLEADERRVVRAQQIHSCGRATCLRFNKHGRLVCKRRAPWPCAEKDDIDEFGNWTPKRSYGFVVNYNPAVSTTLHCNNDAKYLASGDETSSATWYNTKYQTKNQGPSYNLSALLAKAFMYHEQHPPDYEDLLERNRLLLFRCQHLINQEMEVSGPLVMAYLMGYGDTIQSHRYVPLYWAALGRQLKETFPDLQISNSRKQNLEPLGVEDTEQGPRNDVNDQVNTATSACEPMFRGDGEQAEAMNIEFTQSGKLLVTSQVLDYQYRGQVYEHMSFLEYIVDTYEEPIPDDAHNQPPTDDSRARRGRPPNVRGHYGAGHPKHETHRRVRRCRGHNTLPNIIGPWFPRHSNPDVHEYYCASMLALLHPWRSLQSLKGANETWEASFADFQSKASRYQLDAIAGVNYYYQCRTAAQKKAAESMLEDSGGNSFHLGETATHHASREADADYDEGDDIQAADIELTEADLLAFQRTQTSIREVQHAADAINIAEALGVFKFQRNERVESQGIGLAIGDDIAKLERWQLAMAKDALGESDTSEGAIVEDERDPGEVDCQPIGEMAIDTEGDVLSMSNITPPVQEVLTGADPSALLRKQRDAYDIVDWHLREWLAGHQPPQLLMLMPGEGGVGKSKTVQTITDNFVGMGVGHTLVKAAYTGIAASIIDGKTLHVACGIPVNGRAQGAETVKKQSAFWADKNYFIIDEMSMVPRNLLAKISESLQKAKKVAGQVSEDSFGGVNVVLVGDLHQFPPVVAKRQAPLYYPIDLAKDSREDVLGRQIYEEFNVVVRLNEQVRVTDPVWQDVLQHVRYGNCKKEHLDILRSLILTDPRCPTTDFSAPPWNEAVLITPRHATRLEWNRWKTRAFCAQKKRQLVICPAVDTIQGRPLTLLERFACAVKPKHNASREERGGLPNSVELAIGMKVMVTFNVETDLDVANGARGEITKIVLDEREPRYDPEQPEITLQYQPVYVLIKLQRTKARALEGLEKNVLPLYPMRRTFTINTDEHGDQTVTRMQLPLTAAYAFTDYRSQGQTISHSIIDIRKPPTGELTPFHAYVGLSRGHGRGYVRLLDDFDDKLFTNHPNEFLRNEDRRHGELDRTTEIWWNSVKARLAEENLSL